MNRTIRCSSTPCTIQPMENESKSQDPYAALERLGHSELVEFVEQLQNAVDGTEARNDALTARVAKLEGDREILRSRLDIARAELTKLKSNPIGKLASRLTSSEDIEDIPSSVDDAAEEPAAAGLRVATILDEISDACWSPEFDNIRLTRPNWRDQLEAASPDFLFVESAFTGVDGSWARRVAHFGSPHSDLTELTSACRDLGIPTVFWNKEDPVNYPWFIGAASAFDHVFTVDADQIPNYQQDLGHTRIHTLQFAAQPALHYPPAPGTDRPGSVGFAGSYYARKHAERRGQMEMLLTPAIEFGLDIYDRMDRAEDARFAWPEQFLPHIVGSVPYVEMGDVYRRYKVFLNVNTVTDSPTMCARRVFELAATGTPVVSGQSRAIEAIVPHGIVEIVGSAAEASSAVRSLLTDPGRQREASNAGPGWIADSHTYSHRLRAILETV